VAANAPAEAVFGTDPAGQPFAALVDEALPEAPEALAARLGDGALLTVREPAGQAQVEARAQAWADGALVVLVGLPAHDARTTRPIETDRAEGERDRELSTLRSIFAASAAPLGLLEAGPDGALAHVLRNAAAAQALGLEGADLAAVGRVAEAAWTRAATEAGRTGVPVCFDIALHSRTFEVLLSPVAPEGHPRRFLYVAADVTDGRAAAEDLLAVSNRQFKQIAQGIHDGVGQTLVGASMHATALARDLAGTVHSADAERLRGLVAQAVAHLRTFALGLDPLDLDRLGVGDALGRLAADAQAALQVRIEVVDELGPATLHEDVLLDVYRIAQEALTNAVRHGAAAAVRLGLGRGADGRLLLHVDDDGRGIAPGTPATGGMGLRTMRARALRHGGSLDVSPRAEGGTRVRLELPPERVLTPPAGGSRDARRRDAE